MTAFLSQDRIGSLCVETDSGELCAYPVRIARTDEDVIRVMPADPDHAYGAGRTSGWACLVTDEFETYEGIRGVIVRGSLHDDDSGDLLVLGVKSRVGFTFEGTVPAQLAQPQP